MATENEYRIPVKTSRGGNNREHFRVAAKRKKEERALFDYHLKPIALEWRDRVADGLTILVTRIAPGTLDAHDNLPMALKSFVDSVADSLGLRSDRDPRVLWKYAQERGAKGEYAVKIGFSPNPGYRKMHKEMAHDVFRSLKAAADAQHAAVEPGPVPIDCHGLHQILERRILISVTLQQFSLDVLSGRLDPQLLSPRAGAVQVQVAYPPLGDDHGEPEEPPESAEVH